MIEPRVRQRVVLPWAVALLFALLPLLWLWTEYPVRWDSRVHSGTVTGSNIANDDQIALGAGYGAAGVRCYQMHVSHVFEAGNGERSGFQVITGCDLGWLKRFQASLVNRKISVLYSAGSLVQPVVVELISSTHVKLAAGLAVAFFLLAGWLTGVATGRFSSQVFSRRIIDIAPRFYLCTGLLVLFYAGLFVY